MFFELEHLTLHHVLTQPHKMTGFLPIEIKNDRPGMKQLTRRFVRFGAVDF